MAGGHRLYGCTNPHTGVKFGDIDSLEVRPARVGEADELARFDLLCFGEQAWPVEEWRDAVREAGFRTWVVCRSGELLACWVLLLDRPVTYIASLAVDPNWRGRGLGRALMVAAVAQARRAHSRWLELDVDVDNRPARALYARFGFAPLARFREDGRARLTMVRRLNRGVEPGPGVAMMAGA